MDKLRLLESLQSASLINWVKNVILNCFVYFWKQNNFKVWVGYETINLISDELYVNFTAAVWI